MTPAAPGVICMPQTVSGGSAPGGSRPTDSATLHPGLHRRAEARLPRYSPYLYTRRPSPVQTAVFSPTLYTTGPSPVRTSVFPPLCTPEALLLYELPSFPHSVHQKAFSCTNCCLSPTLYTTGPSPVQTAVFSPTLYTTGPSPVRTAAFPSLCTPEGLLLYKLPVGCCSPEPSRFARPHR